MKHFISVLLALLVCDLACAEWIHYHHSPEAEEFFDPAFVLNEKGIIKFWALSNYATPITTLEGKELLSEKSLTTIDCGTRKTGTEKVVRYAGNNAQGAVVGSMETTLRMTSVRPDSADQALIEKLCR
jgi:hypothetical protein